MKSLNEKYEVWFDISISHAYFGMGLAPLTLSPTDNTRIFLSKSRILFKQIESNRWVLLRIKEEMANTDDPDLSFNISINSDEFYYVTAKNITEINPSFSLSDSQYPRIWKTIKLTDPLGNKEKTSEQILLQIPTVEKYLEYICIPKFHPGNINLKMNEDKNNFQIHPPKKVSLPDNVEVIRFVSKDKIPLKKIYTDKVRLWEVRDSGERLISEVIPYPNPSNISIFQPNDTITTYYYF